MKTILNLGLALIAISGFAQSSLNKDVGEFTDIKVYDLITVTMYQSEEENKVVVSGDNPDDIKIVNQKGKLKIRMQPERMYDGKGMQVEVYYTSVGLIDANEGTRITVSEVLKQEKVNLRAQEGGIITVELDVEEATIKAISGGQINSNGSAGSQDITINTGGIYKAKDLETNHTKVKVTAAGSAEINATDVVDVQVVAGGSVYIYGKPKVVNEKKLAGGKIKRMD
jgi:hypothetical protein